ncbi:hypothetical protein D9M69_538190 [compost metagenome]
MRTGHGAAQPVAHAHSDGGRRVALAQHLEVVVEARDLEHLGHGQAHLGRQGHHVALPQAAVRVVERVQVFDQLVAPVRPVADQGAHLGARRVVGLAALELATAPELGTQGIWGGHGNRGGCGHWAGSNHGLVVVRAWRSGRVDNGRLRGVTWQYERHRHSHMSRAA